MYTSLTTLDSYLDVRGTYVRAYLTGFHARRLFYPRSASTSVTTRATGSVISPRLQCVLPCLSVTLSNIMYLLINTADFVSSMLHHVLSLVAKYNKYK